jgi:iron(III) transport system permease protein
MIALATVTVPTTVRSMDAALRGLGTETEFSARLLGAGPAYRLFIIVLPMLRGPLLACWLFAFMLVTIQVSVPLVLRSPSQETLSVMVWTLTTDSGSVGQSSVVALIQGAMAGAVVLLAGLVGRGRGFAA